MIRTLLLGLVLVIAAADGASARKIWGAGVTSCREWQENRTQENLASWQQRSWIAGYLSGYNSASWGRDFLVRQPDAAAIYSWIDNYCRDNPLDDLIHAVTALKDEVASLTGKTMVSPATFAATCAFGCSIE
jgi:hypothetical protein